MYRIGLDWIWLDWIGLDWIGLDWIRSYLPFCNIRALCAPTINNCSVRIHWLLALIQLPILLPGATSEAFFYTISVSKVFKAYTIKVIKGDEAATYECTSVGAKLVVFEPLAG